MANYQNFKSIIVLNTDPLIKDPTITKVSAVPKSACNDPTKPLCLDIYSHNKIKGLDTWCYAAHLYSSKH